MVFGTCTAEEPCGNALVRAAGMGGVADLYRIGDAGDRGRVEIGVGHLQLREHQLGRDRSVACCKDARAFHQGPRGLQQRDKPQEGFSADGLGQMKIEPGLRAAALVFLRAIAGYRNELMSARKNKLLDQLPHRVAVLARYPDIQQD